MSQQYKIKGTGGAEYGPVSTEELQQWIAQNRCTRESLVEVDHAAGVSRRLCRAACPGARVGRGRGRRLDGDPVQERPGAYSLLRRCVLHHLSAAALLPCNHPRRHRAEEGEGKSGGQGNRPCLDRDFVRVIFFTSFHSHRSVCFDRHVIIVLMSSKQIILISSIAMFIIAGAVALFFLDPTKHAFFPKCAFHMATGYSCPGCGSSRALFALTHGNVFEAFRLNPGILCLLTMGVTDFGLDVAGPTLLHPFCEHLAGHRPGRRDGRLRRSAQSALDAVH